MAATGTGEAVSPTKAIEKMAHARSMRARPVLRLQCPSGEHGPGVVLYIHAVDGWCYCGRKLRPMLPSERIR